MASKGRPIGATITGILYIIGGVLAVIGGIMLMVGGSFLTAFLNIPFAAAIGTGLGIFLILVGILDFFIAWGLFSLKNWVRIVATIFSALGLFSFPVGTIVGIVIIYLLWFHKETKIAFH